MLVVMHPNIQITACHDCSNLQPDNRIPNGTQYLLTEYNNVFYSSETPIPLAMTQLHGIFQMHIYIFCLAACHGYDSLSLRVQPVVQNRVRPPARARFGVIQANSTTCYPFMTKPVGQGRVYEWTNNGWSYRN